MRRVLSVLLGLALFAACEPSPVPVAPGSQANLVIDAPPFLHSDAQLSVAHTGTRRFEFPLTAGPASDYRERITTDGHGRFALEPLESSAASPAEWAEFELVQRVRQGFLFRYRDFLVRDAELFTRNWSTTDLQRTEAVAGRGCWAYRIERRGGAGHVFELSIDQMTSLVLASREYDADGRLVAEMAYESFQLEPDLAVAWHEPRNVEQLLESVEAAEAELEAELLRPRLLPDGYAPLEIATVADGQGKTWLKHTYTDGIEPLFFLQALDVPARQVWSSAQGLSAQRVPEASAVMVFDLGAALAIQGKVEGFLLMVIGKVREAELLDLIESSLP